jgi:uncharacterized protein YjiS (DUF1127 family)
MTILNFPAKLNRPSLVARCGIATAPVAATVRALARLFRGRRAYGQDWSTLSPHLLADIGETPASAEAEALRDVFCSPLGSIGFRDRVETGGGPWFSRRTSPLS